MTDHDDDVDDDDKLKIHISRVPTKFDETIVRRILVEHLQATAGIATERNDESIIVELVYPRTDKENEEQEQTQKQTQKKHKQKKNQEDPKEDTAKEEKKEHRGFGFVTFPTQELYDKILSLSTIKGGRKPNSTKLYIMHVRPYTTSPDETNECYLWTQRRCPYGDDCKFTHSGPGACLPVPVKSDDNDDKMKKKGKCFAFKKGKCDKGEDCPFSHDFEPTKPVQSKAIIPKSEKDCISWKSKGKCTKGEKCPYRHDPKFIKKVEDKRKRKREDDGNTSQKKKQPLCIRVFGMAYDTTEDDIRTFFEDCGKIQEVNFPIFEDSGRSKGYCGIWFTSPKAVEKAIELNGQELLGRWLSVQAGKMYLREWEANHDRSNNDDANQISAH